LILYLTGLILKIFLDLLKHKLADIIIPCGVFIKFFTCSLIIYFDAISGVVFWVGGFNLLYLFPGTSWEGMCSVLVISSSLLMLGGGFHSTGGVPLRLSYDSTDSVLRPLGYLEYNPSDGWCKLSLDIIFTHMVGHSLAISCWWSLWELENSYILYPTEMTMKDRVVWDSVVIGYVAAMVAVPLADSVNNMEEGLPKLVAGNGLAWIALVSSLNVWRGLWSIYNYHFLPEFENNLMISHVLGASTSLIFRFGQNLTQTFSKDSPVIDIYSCDYWGHCSPCLEKSSEEEEMSILHPPSPNKINKPEN